MLQNLNRRIEHNPIQIFLNEALLHSQVSASASARIASLFPIRKVAVRRKSREDVRWLEVVNRNFEFCINSLLAGARAVMLKSCPEN